MELKPLIVFHLLTRLAATSKGRFLKTLCGA